MMIYFLVIAIPAAAAPRPFYGNKPTHLVYWGSTKDEVRQEAWEYWNGLNVDLTKFAKNEIHVIEFVVETEIEPEGETLTRIEILEKLLEHQSVALGSLNWTSLRKVLRDRVEAAGLELNWHMTEMPIDYFTYGMVKKEILDSNQELAAIMGHRKMVVMDLLYGAMEELSELGEGEPYYLPDRLSDEGATMYSLVEAYWKHLLAFHAKRGNYSALDVAYKYTPRKFARQLLASKKLDQYIRQGAQAIWEYGKTLTDEDLSPMVVTPDMAITR